MANHKSALKKAKQDRARRERNRAGKSRLRGALKQFRADIEAGNADIKNQLPEMHALIDQSAKHGYIHRNAANRLKSKLDARLNRI